MNPQGMTSVQDCDWIFYSAHRAVKNAVGDELSERLGWRFEGARGGGERTFVSDGPLGQ
jgi:hypothetical protein